MGLLLIRVVNKAFYFEKILCSSCPSKSGHFWRITLLCIVTTHLVWPGRVMMCAMYCDSTSCMTWTCHDVCYVLWQHILYDLDVSWCVLCIVTAHIVWPGRVMMCAMYCDNTSCMTWTCHDAMYCDSTSCMTWTCHDVCYVLWQHILYDLAVSWCVLCIVTTHLVWPGRVMVCAMYCDNTSCMTWTCHGVCYILWQHILYDLDVSWCVRCIVTTHLVWPGRVMMCAMYCDSTSCMTWTCHDVCYVLWQHILYDLDVSWCVLCIVTAHLVRPGRVMVCAMYCDSASCMTWTCHGVCYVLWQRILYDLDVSWCVLCIVTAHLVWPGRVMMCAMYCDSTSCMTWTCHGVCYALWQHILYDLDVSWCVLCIVTAHLVWPGRVMMCAMHCDNTSCMTWTCHGVCYVLWQHILYDLDVSWCVLCIVTTDIVWPGRVMVCAMYCDNTSCMTWMCHGVCYVLWQHILYDLDVSLCVLCIVTTHLVWPGRVMVCAMYCDNTSCMTWTCHGVCYVLWQHTLYDLDVAWCVLCIVTTHLVWPGRVMMCAMYCDNTSCMTWTCHGVCYVLWQHILYDLDVSWCVLCIVTTHLVWPGRVMVCAMYCDSTSCMTWTCHGVCYVLWQHILYDLDVSWCVLCIVTAHLLWPGRVMVCDMYCDNTSCMTWTCHDVCYVLWQHILYDLDVSWCVLCIVTAHLVWPGRVMMCAMYCDSTYCMTWTCHDVCYVLWQHILYDLDVSWCVLCIVTAHLVWPGRVMMCAMYCDSTSCMTWTCHGVCYVLWQHILYDLDVSWCVLYIVTTHLVWPGRVMMCAMYCDNTSCMTWTCHDVCYVLWQHILYDLDVSWCVLCIVTTHLVWPGRVMMCAMYCDSASCKTWTCHGVCYVLWQRILYDLDVSWCVLCIVTAHLVWPGRVMMCAMYCDNTSCMTWTCHGVCYVLWQHILYDLDVSWCVLCIVTTHLVWPGRVMVCAMYCDNTSCMTWTCHDVCYVLWQHILYDLDVSWCVLCIVTTHLVWPGRVMLCAMYCDNTSCKTWTWHGVCYVLWQHILYDLDVSWCVLCIVTTHLVWPVRVMVCAMYCDNTSCMTWMCHGVCYVLWQHILYDLDVSWCVLCIVTTHLVWPGHVMVCAMYCDNTSCMTWTYHDVCYVLWQHILYDLDVSWCVLCIVTTHLVWPGRVMVCAMYCDNTSCMTWTCHGVCYVLWQHILYDLDVSWCVLCIVTTHLVWPGRVMVCAMYCDSTSCMTWTCHGVCSSIPPSSIPLSSIPPSSIPLSSIPPSSIPLSSIPLSSIPLSSIPPSSIPLSSIPLSSPLSLSSFLSHPLPSSTPFLSSSLPSSPPLSSSPLSLSSPPLQPLLLSPILSPLLSPSFLSHPLPSLPSSPPFLSSYLPSSPPLSSSPLSSPPISHPLLLSHHLPSLTTSPPFLSSSLPSSPPLSSPPSSSLISPLFSPPPLLSPLTPPLLLSSLSPSSPSHPILSPHPLSSFLNSCALVWGRGTVYHGGIKILFATYEPRVRERKP